MRLSDLRFSIYDIKQLFSKNLDFKKQQLSTINQKFKILNPRMPKLARHSGCMLSYSMATWHGIEDSALNRRKGLQTNKPDQLWVEQTFCQLGLNRNKLKIYLQKFKKFILKNISYFQSSSSLASYLAQKISLSYQLRAFTAAQLLTMITTTTTMTITMMTMTAMTMTLILTSRNLSLDGFL